MGSHVKMNEAVWACPGPSQLSPGSWWPWAQFTWQQHSLARLALSSLCGLTLPIQESQVVALTKSASLGYRDAEDCCSFSWPKSWVSSMLWGLAGLGDLEIWDSLERSRWDSISSWDHREVIQTKNKKCRQDREVYREKPWESSRELEFYPHGTDLHQPRTWLNKIIQSMKIILKAR